MALAERKTKEIEQNKGGLTKDELVIEYLPYVKYLAHRIVGLLPAGVEVDDLVNTGIIGLMDAFNKYDSGRDTKFMTYACYRIKGAMLSELRSRDFLSRSTRKKIRKLEAAYSRLEEQHKREVTDEEVALELGVELEEVHKIKKMAGIYFVSLEELGHDSGQGLRNAERYLFQPEGGDADSLTVFKETEELLGKAIDELPERERMVVSLYYWDELTMKEIGMVLDLTESRVSQLHSQAVLRLRKKLRNQGLIGEA